MTARSTADSSSRMLWAVVWFGVLLLVALPVGLIVGGLQEKAKAEPVKHGLTTTGTIVDSDPVDSFTGKSSITTYDPTVSFTDRDGHVHLFDAPTVDGKPRLGAEVKVSYDPRNPGHATDLSVGSLRWKAFFFSGLGLAILELGIAGWAGVRRLGRRRAAA